jgi:hypothetical protein
VAALLRRTAASTSVIALVLLAWVAMAVGSGSDLIADYQSNGQVTGCYSEQDFQEALQELRADERLYGNAIEVIQEARATNVADADGNCPGAAEVEAVEDDSGSGAGLWIGLAAAVGLIAVGAGLWARRGGAGEGDGPGSGEDGPGDDPSGPPARA